MNDRDRYYIDDRLSTPCNAALQAHERLQQVYEGPLAARLMAAMQVFTDECRAIRKDLP